MLLCIEVGVQASRSGAASTKPMPDLPPPAGRSPFHVRGSSWIAPMVTGYAPEVLRAAGAIAARAHVAAPRREGVRLGIETVALTLHFSWS